MNNRVDFSSHEDPQIMNQADVLKLTALIYLQDAIQQERYEQGAELIVHAKKFGARQEEIDAAILEVFMAVQLAKSK